jgi:hypothetical protein
MASNTELKSLNIHGQDVFYRADILENPEPFDDDMVAFFHGVKDLYQVSRGSDYGQILLEKLKAAASREGPSVNALVKRVTKLGAALQEVVAYHYRSSQGILPKSHMDRIEKLLGESYYGD